MEDKLDNFFFLKYLCTTNENSVSKFTCKKFRSFIEADEYYNRQCIIHKNIPLYSTIIPIFKFYPERMKYKILANELLEKFYPPHIELKLID